LNVGGEKKKPGDVQGGGKRGKKSKTSSNERNGFFTSPLKTRGG